MITLRTKELNTVRTITVTRTTKETDIRVVLNFPDREDAAAVHASGTQAGGAQAAAVHASGTQAGGPHKGNSSAADADTREASNAGSTGAVADRRGEPIVSTGVPFFDHMLYSMLFHGGFSGEVSAKGDIDVDAHHTVEDVGIVIGQALARVVDEYGPVRRYGHAVIPMDDALAEAVVDAAGRAYLVFNADFPQSHAGAFDLALVREFFQGLSSHAQANVHVHGRYGLNGHHLAEAMFKSAGRALGQAYLPSTTVRSTKGSL